MINTQLLDILCCPIGKTNLKYENDFLICMRCGVRFPIIDDIPVLLIDEAILPQGITNISDLPCQKEQQNQEET